jgi:hypothetical protein
VFAKLMNNSDHRSQIRAQGGLTTDYEVTVEEDAPILNVTAKADRPAVAIATVQELLGEIPNVIDNRENLQRVDENDRLLTDQLSTPDRATELNAAKTRALVAFIALGLAAVLSVALLVESWSQSAKTRRDRRRLTVAVPGPTPVPSAAGPAPVPTPGAATPPSGPTPVAPARGAPAAKRATSRGVPAKANDADAGREKPVPAEEANEDDLSPKVAEGSSRSSAVKQPGRARPKPRRRNPAAS